MDTWLSEYKAVVCQQPHLNDSWFQRDLEGARRGDDVARRRILGSSLSLVLDIVEQLWEPSSGVDLVDFLQDANHVMENALASFCGNNVEEYVQHLQQAVKAGLGRG
jgi:hypothetical protein